MRYFLILLALVLSWDSLAQNLSTKKVEINVAGSIVDMGSSSFKSKASITPIGTGKLEAPSFRLRVGFLPVPFNQDPTDIALSANTIEENEVSSTLIGEFSTTDPELNDFHSYTLVSGEGSDDNTSFTISGNQLLSAEVFDFEIKNQYTIRVRTDDGDGGGIKGVFEKVFTIDIINVNDTPTDIKLDGNDTDSIDENLLSGKVISTLTTIDQDISSNGDTHTYSLVTGAGDTDNASFSISGDQLLSAETFDFETKINYNVRIRTTDSEGAIYEEDFIITVEDTNDGPTDISLSGTTYPTFVENDIPGTLIANISTTDVDNGIIVAGDNIDESHVYTLVNGEGDADNALFQINGSTVEVKDTLNFERPEGTDFTFRLRTTDLAGSFYEESFIISVTDKDDAPTGLSKTSYSIAEGNLVGATVGILSPIDEDIEPNGNFQFVIIDGDASDFSINGNTLIANSVYEFVDKREYSITVRINDVVDLVGNSRPINQLFFDQQIDVFILAEGNEPPENITLSTTTFKDNLETGSIVTEISTSDPDDTQFTYSLVNNAPDNNKFTINGSQLVLATDVDINTQTTFEIEIQTSDGKGGIFSKQFTLTLEEFINSAPTDIELSSNTLDQNTEISTVVGQLSAVDIDANESFTFTFESGDGDTDNSAFSISGNQLLTAQTYDYNIKSSLSIRVQVEDNYGGFYSEIFTIEVVNNDPTDILLSNSSIQENNESGSLVGDLSTIDADNTDTHSYQLVTGSGDGDNNLFSISENQLFTASVLDFETKAIYNIRVQTNDGNGGVYEEALSINVTDVNEAPILAPIGNKIVDEQTILAFIVSGSDVDQAGQNLTYTIDQASAELGITLNSSSGEFSWTPSEAQDGSYTITFTVSDGSLSDTETISLTVNEVNQAPVISTIDNQIIDEEKEFTFNISATDSDIPEQELKFFLDAVSVDKGMVLDSLSGVFTWTPSEDQDGSQNVTFSVTDGELTDSRTVIILVNEVSENAAPSDLTLSATQVFAFEAEGSIVGNFSTSDIDNATHSYSILSGNGFGVDGNRLVTAQMFTNTQDSTASITVQTEDPLGATFVQSFTIDILAETIPPIISGIESNPQTIESGTSGTDVSVTVTDAGLHKVFFFSKPFTAEDFTSEEVTSTTDIFSVLVTPDKLESTGLEYYFTAIDLTGNESSTVSRKISLNFPGEGENARGIPSITRFGGKIEDYQVISIPYKFSGSNARVDAIFDEYGGNPDKTSWRLIRFDNTRKQLVDLTGSYGIKLGEAYFFNAREEETVNIGAASINDQDPFTITLQQGWNLIGNPYSIDLDWPTILANNDAADKVNALRVLQPDDPAAWPESTTLKAFEGGLVFATETIPIAITYQDLANARVSGYEMPDYDWFVPLTLSQAGNQNTGGVGMHQDANTSLDGYDGPTLPRWFRYLEFEFENRDYPLSRDIIDTRESYVWDFKVASDQKGETVLNWAEPSDKIKNLQLLDVSTGKLVNMKKRTSYQFSLSSERAFKILYSEDPADAFINERILIQEVYPNPTQGKFKVTLSLPLADDSYNIAFHLVDLTGRKVLSQQRVVNATTLTLDIEPETGLSNGLYFLEIEVENGSVQTKMTHKLVIKK